MSTRVLAAADRIANEHEGGRILIVSHGGPIRAIHGAALGMDVEDYRRIRPVEPNARLSAVCVEDGRLTELCPAGRVHELLANDPDERPETPPQPPAPPR